MFVTSNISNFIKNENKVITHSPAEKKPLYLHHRFTECFGLERTLQII